MFLQKFRFQKILWPEILQDEGRVYHAENLENVKKNVFFEDFDLLLQFRCHSVFTIELFEKNAAELWSQIQIH